MLRSDELRAVRARLALAALAALLGSTSVAHASGPLLLANPAARQPYAWASPVNLYTDLGTLGAVTNAQADNLVTASGASWTAVGTSSLVMTVPGDVSLIGLPDVTLANVAGVIGVDNPGNGITVIYDTNGSITQNFLGAPPGVLGVASPEFALGVTLTEGWMVLNGASINPADLPNATSFHGVITHEMGHAINLAHSQANGAIVFFGDGRGPGACAIPYPAAIGLNATETMFPFIDVSPGSTGVQQASVENLDDTAALSEIYPVANYGTAWGTITGKVFRPDGVTEITGVNVIARNVANPYLNAQSCLSGDYTQGAVGPDGLFRLTGLTPGATYALYVDTIIQGGFSTPPVIPLPGPEEFWNNGETNNDVFDPPCDVTPLVVAAGQVITADIQLNAAGLPPVISVSPTSINLSVAAGSITNLPLTISNVAGAGGLPLNWSIVDVQASTGLPLFGTASLVNGRVGASDRVSGSPVIARPRVLDSRDPALQRQCTPGADRHGAHKTPIELGGPADAISAVNDGGFELGVFGGAWTETSTNFGSPICDASCGNGGLTGPNSGAYWCWFGGIVATEIGSVSQSVAFPSAASLSLEFFLDKGGCDSTNDFMEVLVDGTQVFFVDGAAANCADGPGYELVSVDVSAYADGGNHTLTFRSEVYGTNAGVTNFFLDDISLVTAFTPCAWLGASPNNGSTPQGGNSNVTVTIDATGLVPGLYSCELQIASNDAATPLVVVPVDIEVTGAGGIDVFARSVANGPVSVFSPPNGAGDPLSGAQLWSGVIGDPTIVTDATIEVRLVDSVSGTPIVGYPPQNITVVAEFGGWAQCALQVLEAEAPTDVNGFTFIRGPLFATGASGPIERMQVLVNDPAVVSTNYPLGASGLPILVNSSDLSGDFAVDLVDLGIFSAAYGGPYSYAVDYRWDGVLNLSDLGRFAGSYATLCTAPPVVVADARPATPVEPSATIGVYFDPQGESNARALVPGQLADAWVVVRGPAAQAGIDAWDLVLRGSDNLVVESSTPLGRALDLSAGADHVVGLQQPLRADATGSVALLHVQVRVTDERPAYLYLEASDRSRLALPGLASGGELRTAQPVSGDVELPVASLNDVDFAAGDTAPGRRSLAMSVAPNPFNPRTTIQFSLPRSGNVELRIVDVRGQLVRVLRNEAMDAGEHSVTWDGTDRTGNAVGSGVYYATLVTPVGERVEKMMLVK